MNSDIRKDPAFRALIAAWISDPRNPHMIPAIIDYFERAELPQQARLLRKGSTAFHNLALAMKEQRDERTE